MRAWTLPALMVFTLALTGCALATKAPPIANAGQDVTVRVGDKVTWDGSRSYDPDGGEIVYYQWRITATPEGREPEIGTVLREGPDAAIWSTARFSAPEDVGRWVIELQVTDEESRSATDDMTLTVTG